MRRFLTAFLTIAASAALFAGDTSPVVDLGIPVTTPNRISYKTAREFGHKKQDLLCWTTTAESGGSFCATDLSTGQLWVHPLHSLEAYPIVFGSDSRVYVGSTSGEVMYWDPATDGWGPLGKPLFQRPGVAINHVRVLCEGRDGWLYAGSCYGERARIDPRTGEQESLPDLTEQGSWYVSAATALPDGKIAFGFGHKAKVLIYDPAVKRDIAQVLPLQWQEDGFCFNLLAGNTVLYATHFPSGRRGVISLDSLAFAGEIPWPAYSHDNSWSRWVHCSGHGSAVDFYLVPGTNCVVTCDGEKILRFDPFNPTTSAVLPLTEFDPDPALALALRYEVTADCRILEYDHLRLQRVKERRPEMPQVERTLFSLGLGPDGNIYGGAYQSTLLFRYDRQKRMVQLLGDHHPGWSGETFSYAIRFGELICGSYTNGAVVSYSPGRIWECAVDAMVNPRRIGFFGQHLYRPLCMSALADGTVWAVGPAGWGSKGGGLGRISPDDSIVVTPLAFIPHTVLPLGEERLLLGCDSLLVIWDVRLQREVGQFRTGFKCLDICQVDGVTRRMAALTDDGRVVLLRPDPERCLVAEGTIRLPFATDRILTRSGELVAGGSSGFMTIDPATGVVSRFCDTPLGSRWAFVIAGNAIYFGAGSHLMECLLPE